MKRVKLNAIVDMVAFGVLLLSVFTGIIPWVVLPSGGGGPRVGQQAAHALFLGLERGAWRDLHTYTSFAFAALVLIHIVLHWQWIRCIPRFFSRGRPESCETAGVCQSDEAEGQAEEMPKANLDI